VTLTDTQIAELDKKLDPDSVRTRQQGGVNLPYIESWHAIAEANRIFGHAEWISETVDLIENAQPTQNQKGNYVVSFRARVRVHVNGIYRDGVGFGSGIAKDVHDAYEGAVKEAESDARKRALMTFGWPFGLALYDEERRHVGKEVKPVEQGEYDELGQALQNAESLDDLKQQWTKAYNARQRMTDDQYKFLEKIKDDRKTQLQQPEPAGPDEGDAVEAGVR